MFKSMLSLGVVLLCSTTEASDRITMMDGDIFLADILKIENHRYHFNRNGHLDILPAWWIKQVESDIDQLPVQATELILTPESRPELAGQNITITSATPAIASHLELYPKTTHYWRQSGTYLRGYIANNTVENFKRMDLKLVYYDADQNVRFTQSTEVFRAYGKTMKPFVVNTRLVPWKNIDRLEIQLIGHVKMK